MLIKKFAGRLIKMFIAIPFLFIVSPLFAQNDTLRVLFIGNSHTYVNDLPTMFLNLAQSGGHTVIKDMSAPGGYTFQQHTTNNTTLSKINQGIWDYVVLQEQSQYPVIEYYRDSSMYPSARILDSLIRRNNEHTAFYMTWGWRDGGQHTINGHSSPDFRDYYHMQDSVTSAYTRIAAELNAILLPAGNAWKIAKTIDTSLALWIADGYHPALIGTYLTACVFYAEFFNESPVGLTYTAGISPETAAFLQTCAGQAALPIDNPVIAVPRKFEILGNYPNPFNGSTNIEYSLSQPGRVTVVIYDILGRRIENLIDENQAAGKYLINWKAGAFPTGIYFVRLKMGDYSDTRKITMAR
jgi:hypothetical protein